MPSMRTSRRNYNRISANHHGDDDDATTNSNIRDTNNENALDEPLSPSSSSLDNNNDNNNDHDKKDSRGGSLSSKSSPSPSPSLAPPIHNEINVILMDAAQSKFNIKCDPQWKVSEFKDVSAGVTKVPPPSQRLIHMGKLLRDDATLGEFGITEDDKIIHLFPKPNVVIHNNNSSSNNTASTNGNNDQSNGNSSGDNANNDGGGGAEGAHVPQIVLDAEEASRRSQILILSSQEIFEAQHRVKIFSFLLMIISSMELLTLMTLFVGVQAEDPTGNGGGSTNSAPPGNPTDTPPTNNASMQMRTWQDSDYFDTLISAFGFYVSLLGIKATTENTLQLAKRYFLCLVAAGIGYNCYYYYTNVQQEQKHAEERNQHIGPSELYTTAFMGILLPLTVWLLCIIRAYQFQNLIREAELEAEERTRGLNGNGEGGTDGGEGEMARSLPYGSDDLELAAERGIST